MSHWDFLEGMNHQSINQPVEKESKSMVQGDAPVRWLGCFTTDMSQGFMGKYALVYVNGVNMKHPHMELPGDQN